MGSAHGASDRRPDQLIPAHRRMGINPAIAHDGGPRQYPWASGTGPFKLFNEQFPALTITWSTCKPNEGAGTTPAPTMEITFSSPVPPYTRASTQPRLNCSRSPRERKGSKGIPPENTGNTTVPWFETRSRGTRIHILDTIPSGGGNAALNLLTQLRAW